MAVSPAASWRIDSENAGDTGGETAAGESPAKVARLNKSKGSGRSDPEEKEPAASTAASSKAATPTAAAAEAAAAAAGAPAADAAAEAGKTSDDGGWWNKKEKAAGKDKGNGGGGGGTSGRKDKDKDKDSKRERAIKSQDRGLHHLLSLLVKSSLQSHQRIRDLQGVMYDVFILSADNPVPQAMVKAGQAYAHRAWQMRTSEGASSGLGPPHPQVWMAMLEVLKDADVGAANKEKLQQVYDLHNGLTLDQACEVVRCCRQDSTYNSDRKKITLGLSQDLRPVLIASMQQIGAEYKPGKPPTGAMERELASWLPSLWTD